MKAKKAPLKAKKTPRKIFRGDRYDNKIIGSAKSDLLLGLKGNDTILGGKGNDIVLGGGGDDLIDGGKGDNRLSGGRGRDTFIPTSSGFDTIADFSPSHDVLDLSTTSLRSFDDVKAALTSSKRGLKLQLSDNARVIMRRIRLSDLSEGNFIFAKEDSNRPPEDDVEIASPGEIVASSGVNRFYPVTGAIYLEVTGGATISPGQYLSVSLNGTLVQAGAAVIDGDGQGITLNLPLVEGANRIEVYTEDTTDGLLELDEVFWAGSQSLSVRILDENGSPLEGVSVLAKLQEDQAVSAVATTGPDGSAVFDNLPNRNILIEAAAAINRFGSVVVPGGQGAVTLALTPFFEPSPINNNDFSLGLDGWNVGTAPVSLVPHQEPNAIGATLSMQSAGVEIAAFAESLSIPLVRGTSSLAGDSSFSGTMSSGVEAESSLATQSISTLAADVDMDLILSTAGEGEQSISRTFSIASGTQSVSVRFQFITSEIPGGYFGSDFNDYYRVSIRSKEGGGVVSESNTMNGLGLGAFDFASGATAFREVSLPTSKEGDTVQVEIAVANVGDGAFDSSVVVDLVQKSPIAITALDLNDIDNSDLNYLSASANNPYFSGNTRINGTITITGAENTKLSSLVLEVLSGGSVVATANLAGAAQGTLIGQEFGADKTLAITTSNLLFEIPNTAAASIPTAEDGNVQLRVRATTADGMKAEREFGSVDILTRYEGANRYGNRDHALGGDDWAKPSTIKVIEHFADDIIVGDFSNMNGGAFSPHASHRGGSDVDGWFSGYNERDAATADRMIELLNDNTYGSNIRTVFVTYQAVAGNAFFDAISNVSLDDGRSAVDVIRPHGGHTTHFHWVIDA